MKKTIIFFILFLYCSIFEGQFVFHGKASNPPSDTDVKIISIEQFEERLLVVVSEESNGEAVLDDPIYELPSLSVMIEAPSIAVYDIVDYREDQLIDRERGRFLWLDGIYSDIGTVEEYDPQLISDWITSVGFGAINIKDYPWVHFKEYGWFWVMEGETWEGLPTFWLISNDFGWLWTSREIFPMVWSQRFGLWIRLVKKG